MKPLNWWIAVVIAMIIAVIMYWLVHANQLILSALFIITTAIILIVSIKIDINMMNDIECRL